MSTGMAWPTGKAQNTLRPGEGVGETGNNYRKSRLGGLRMVLEAQNETSDDHQSNGDGCARQNQVLAVVVGLPALCGSL